MNFKSLFLGLLFVASQNLLAHSGHDHSAPQSSFIHAELITALLLLAASGIYFVTKNYRCKHATK